MTRQQDWDRWSLAERAAYLDQLARTVFQHCCSILIGCPSRSTSDASSGSGILIRLDSDYYVITAKHVVDGLSVKRRTGPAHLQIGMLNIDPDDRLVHTSAQRDIAVLAIDLKETQFVARQAYEHVGDWPPPLPVEGSCVLLNGFAALNRIGGERGSIESKSLHVTARVGRPREGYFLRKDRTGWHANRECRPNASTWRLPRGNERRSRHGVHRRRPFLGWDHFRAESLAGCCTRLVSVRDSISGQRKSPTASVGMSAPENVFATAYELPRISSTNISHAALPLARSVAARAQYWMDLSGLPRHASLVPAPITKLSDRFADYLLRIRCRKCTRTCSRVTRHCKHSQMGDTAHQCCKEARLLEGPCRWRVRAHRNESTRNTRLLRWAVNESDPSLFLSR